MREVKKRRQLFPFAGYKVKFLFQFPFGPSPSFPLRSRKTESEDHCTAQLLIDAGRSFTVFPAVGLGDINIFVVFAASNIDIH